MQIIKKVIILLSLTFVTSIACAETYVYLENPDPSKYKITWNGPEPNCSETSGGYQTKGWIRHPWGEEAWLWIAPIDRKGASCGITLGFIPSLPGVTCSSAGYCYVGACDVYGTDNTLWVTIKGKGHKPYRTWVCG